ncbi:MAG: hypothetical protein RRY96_06660, partial [Ruthenibacterium sp.]
LYAAQAAPKGTVLWSSFCRLSIVSMFYYNQKNAIVNQNFEMVDNSILHRLQNYGTIIEKRLLYFIFMS